MSNITPTGNNMVLTVLTKLTEIWENTDIDKKWSNMERNVSGLTISSHFCCTGSPRLIKLVWQKEIKGKQ